MTVAGATPAATQGSVAISSPGTTTTRPDAADPAAVAAGAESAAVDDDARVAVDARTLGRAPCGRLAAG